MRKFFASFLEIFEIIVVAVVAVFIVRNFIVQPFLVSGTSMVPTFQNGDYVLVDELTFHIRPPERGEVIVFHDPEPGDYNTYFIKRIIGLPGDTVQIQNGGVTIFNTQYPQGLKLNETYLPSNVITLNNGGPDKITLASSTYFMLGDNRENSFDSRSWGPLNENNIVGLVRIRLWPFDKIKIFSDFKY
jgi:signal peptidase I